MTNGYDLIWVKKNSSESPDLLSDSVSYIEKNISVARKYAVQILLNPSKKSKGWKYGMIEIYTGYYDYVGTVYFEKNQWKWHTPAGKIYALKKDGTLGKIIGKDR